MVSGTIDYNGRRFVILARMVDGHCIATLAEETGGTTRQLWAKRRILWPNGADASLASGYGLIVSSIVKGEY